MAEYNKLQVQQLTDLIQVTRTELKKEDRQKVMNMITIDAHSRDMIEQVCVLVRHSNVQTVYVFENFLLIAVPFFNYATYKSY